MDASNPITAAVFSAFLKCSTKAHLLAIGEPAPDSFFANIEARISSMYRTAAERRLRIGANAIKSLAAGGKIGRPPLSPNIAVWHPRAHAVFALGQAGYLRQPPPMFRCARAVAGHWNTGRHRNTDLRRRATPKNCKDRGPLGPDSPG